VAYAQQLQAETAGVREDLEGRLRAAEARARTAANDAQDWQIRHRESEAQVQELAQSLAGAEERLAGLRDERDELLAALDDATNPQTVLETAQPD
jgi:chromosome segregation ATPase